MKKQHENDPVLFIAVNSGNPKRSVEGYMTSVKSEWPALADTDRTYEKKFDFGEISTSNIFQAVVVDAGGTVHTANAMDLAPSVKQVVSTAKWKIPPAEIPDALKKAWRALEFGQMSVAAPIIKQASSASDAKVKEAAKKLEAVVVEEITSTLANAKAELDAGKKWEAYKLYDYVATNFKLFAEAKPAAAEMSKLGTDPKVKREVQARTMLQKCNELLASPKKTEQQQGQMGLQTLTQQFADTEAGEQAKSMGK
ncbi:MAG TPA: hypothetical protein VEK08_10755 [Planctomycetota bacterium]|nr:hypothetical protein [Planctomycetota bacterium]